MWNSPSRALGLGRLSGMGAVPFTATYPVGLSAACGTSRQYRPTPEASTSEVYDIVESIVTPADNAPTTIRRGAIIGTAPTYRNTPWDDTTLDCFSLNDAYVLPHFKRASGWFDLHPIPEMVFRPKGERKVRPEHAPVGGYLRPEGHLEWLKTRTFPVYLHDCTECDCAARLEKWSRGELPGTTRPHDPYPFPKWPNARPFPQKAVDAKFGTYFSSTPALMLAWMLMESYREVQIFGIHLATEWEYIMQRPNMEFLIGIALSQGVQFIIPEKSTLLKGKHRYAVESKPDLDLERVQRRMALIKDEGARLQQRLAKVSWYARGEKDDIRARLGVLDLELLDCRQEYGRLAAISRVA